MTGISFAIYEARKKGKKNYFETERLYRTIWNDKLKIDRGYEFGKENETISSALGKNERDNTLSKKGKLLVKILDFFDENHCKNSIDLTKGDWYFEPE